MSGGSHNRNPTGKNQHPDCPQPDDAQVTHKLTEYHQRGIHNRKTISSLLRVDLNVQISPATVGRRLAAAGLYASGVTTKALPDTVKRQLVLDQLAKDPTQRHGPRLIQEDIRHDTGIELTRDYVTEEMRLHEPEAFEHRLPGKKDIPRKTLVCCGPNERWSADGHDKLAKIGFLIWGVRDVWCGMWMGLWVVPNNRLKIVIAYLFLSLVNELGGIPLQMTTDAGSETTELFGLINALREIFAPDFPLDELPAHRFLKSVHNIVIERGWLRFRIQWGDNVLQFWEAGQSIYDASSPDQYELVQWLWSTLLRREVSELKTRFNNHKVRRDDSKFLPSGVAPSIAYTLYEDYGVKNYLQPVDRATIKQIMDDMGGEELIQFVTPEYAERAQEVYDYLGIGELTLQNVWSVFSAMLPLMSVAGDN